MLRLLRTAAASLALAAPACLLAQVPAVTTAPVVAQKEKLAHGGLYQIVYNPVDDRLYVASLGPAPLDKARVLIVDPSTLKQVGEIDVSQALVFGLGIDTRAQLLYGTATREGVVSVIDIKSHRVTNIKPEGSSKAHLREVVADEATGKAYAGVIVPGQRGAGADAPFPMQEIWVIDGAGRKVERVIPVELKGLMGLALDAAGGRLFATGLMSNEVVSIDIESGAVKARWPSGGESPINVAYDAAGNRLFVAHQKSGELTVLDAATGALRAKLATGAGALSVAYNPEKQHIYVANRGAGTVSVVDGRSYALLANLATGTHPQTIAIDRMSGTVFVTNKSPARARGAPANEPRVDDPNGDTVVSIRP